VAEAEQTHDIYGIGHGAQQTLCVVASGGRVLKAPGRCALMMRCAGIRRQGTYWPRSQQRGPAVPKFTDPGKWYFVVDCLDCESPIPLADAPSPAEKPDPLRYRVVSEVKCPHCGSVGTYTPDQISRRQVEHARGDRFQAPILYVFAGIAALTFLVGVFFVTRTYR
jgi:hypothetical protein